MQGTRPRAPHGSRPAGGRRRARRRAGPIVWLNVLAAALVGAGITIALVGHDTLRWAPPPVPPAWAAGHPAHPPQYRYRARPRVLAPAEPVSIEIPAIKVRARITELGLAADGSIAVPPLSTASVTGWYDRGPAPGSPGASVILGHVDAAGVGPAVFYYLGNLRPGNRIYVRLSSGRTAIFEAYSVGEYLKTKFPTARVYGYTSWPTLRLVTCGGYYDPRTRHYLGNTVVFATYVGQRRS
jgi:Sortase domain